MLSLNNITKKYGKQTVLDSLSISFEPGEFVMILGPNGSGKSTLLSIIASAIKPAGGQVSIDGKEGGAAKGQVSYVPQDIVLFEELNAVENLYCWSDKAMGETAATIESLSQELGMKDFMKKRVSRLSGGQRRRVSIAAGLINDRRYVVMDEPFAGIDRQGADLLLGLLNRLKSEGKCVIICEHNESFLKDRVTRIVRIENGQIVSDDN